MLGLGFPRLEDGRERLRRARVVGLGEAEERLLHEERRAAGRREAGEGVDLRLRPLRGGAGHEPQQVDPVAAGEVGGRRLERRDEPRARDGPRALAVHDEQVEDHPPPVAALLGLELLQQRLDAEACLEERHEGLQLRVALRLLHVCPKALRVESLVAPLQHRLGEARLHLLLLGQPTGELQHPHGAPEVPLVEQLRRRRDEVPEPGARLCGVLRERDDLLHRPDLVRWRCFRRLGQPLAGQRPVGQLLAEAAEDLTGAGGYADRAQKLEVLDELGRALRLVRGNRESLGRNAPARPLGIGAAGEPVPPQPLLEQRQAAAAGGRRREPGRVARHGPLHQRRLQRVGLAEAREGGAERARGRRRAHASTRSSPDARS